MLEPPKKLRNLFQFRDAIHYIVRTHGDPELKKLGFALQEVDLPDNIRVRLAEEAVKILTEKYGFEVDEKLKEKLKKAPIPPVLLPP